LEIHINQCRPKMEQEKKRSIEIPEEIQNALDELKVCKTLAPEELEAFNAFSNNIFKTNQINNE